MSNFGQAALIIVGTVVGYEFGMPQLGFVLGSIAGQLLFPTQQPTGPRLHDNKTTTATIGVPVPIVFGTADVAGNVIWLAKIVEHRNSGGKAGGDTFSYTQSIAIGLCERIDPDAADNVGAIAGVSRIWENGAIVFDIRPQQSANTLLNTLAETDAAYAHRLAASAQYAASFTLHLGDETQVADPTIEAIEGIGNVPAFRGLAYIVYPNRPLKLTQGQRHPNFTFEVYSIGLGPCVDAPFLSNNILEPWAGGLPGENPMNGLNLHTAQIVYADDAIWPIWPGTVYPSLSDALGVAAFALEYPLIFLDYATGIQPSYGNYLAICKEGGIPVSGTYDFRPGYNLAAVDLHYNFTQPHDGWFTDQQRYPNTGGIPYSLYDANIPNKLWHQQVQNFGQIAHSRLPYWVDGAPTPVPTFPFPSASTQDPSPGGVGCTFEFIYDLQVRVTRQPHPPIDPCTGLPPSIENPGYCFDALSGTFIKSMQWVYTDDGGGDTSKYAVMSQYNPLIGGNVLYPWNPCVERSEPNYPGNPGSEAFWTAAYNDLAAQGKLPGGWTYGAQYPVYQSWAYRINRTECQGAGAYAHVDAIITAICRRAGMSLSEIDVSDLSVPTVPGYAISSISNGASIIAPLRSVAFFDAVESGAVLKFPTRGKGVVATLTPDQFGCYDASAAGASAPGPAITSVRADETTLPRSIRLHYSAVSRDYQTGDAQSPFRLTTSAINDQDVSLPMVLEDHQAMKCAEVLWTDAWAGKIAHDLAIDQSLWALEGADCIAVPVDGVLQRIRIVSDKNASGVLRTLSCVRDSEGAYVSFATAAAPGHVLPVLSITGQTPFEMLDLPALADWDNNAGVYLAAQRTIGYDWTGAAVFKSIDGGATFTSLPAIATESTIGSVTGPVAVGTSSGFDDVTVIEVLLDPYYSLVSRTDLALAGGANMAAVGANRRWELLQFGTATQVDATHWHLTHLLRGRRGTEYLIGASLAGDTFVMVSDANMLRVMLNLSERGQSRVYRTISRGLTVADAVDHAFAGNAQALVPFAPVDLGAVFSTSLDWELSWRRRDRFGVTGMISPPLSEASELYEVDIFSDASFTSVVHTITGITTPYANYFAADGAVSGGVFFEVYQISAAVGRGTGARYPLYGGAGGPPIITPPGLPIDSSRSTNLAYLQVAKSGYPGWSVSGSGVEAQILEWRFRFPGGHYVVDVQGGMQYVGGAFDPGTNSLAYGNSDIARFDDGAGTPVARTNANHLVWADKDPAETRYVYVARLYSGTGYSGPGIIQKIDTQAIVHSPVHELDIVATASVGISGDPWQVLQIGAKVFTLSNYDQRIERFAALNLAFEAAFAMNTGGIPWVKFLMRGPSGSLWALTQTDAQRVAGVHAISQLSTSTLAVLSSFVVSSDPAFSVEWEGVIVGNYLYGFFIDSGASPSYTVRKFNITTGVAEAFTYVISATGNSRFNYIQADGTLITVGRYPDVYVIDTASDTVTTYPSGP